MNADELIGEEIRGKKGIGRVVAVYVGMREGSSTGLRLLVCWKDDTLEDVKAVDQVMEN